MIIQQNRILLALGVVIFLLILEWAVKKNQQRLSCFWQELEFRFLYFRFICDQIFLRTFKILGSKSEVKVSKAYLNNEIVEIVPNDPRWVWVCIDKNTNEVLVKPYFEVIYERTARNFTSRKTSYDFCKAVAKYDSIEFVFFDTDLLPGEKNDLKSRAVSSINLKHHLMTSHQSVGSNEPSEQILEKPTESIGEFLKRLEIPFLNQKRKKKKPETFLSGFLSDGKKTM